MFILKKLIAPLFFPLTMSGVLLLAGVYLLWFTGRQRAGKIMVTCGALILLVAANPVPATIALHRMEHTYPAFAPASMRAPLSQQCTSFPTNGSVWVAVLGTGYAPNPDLPANSQIDTTFLSRFVEAARLCRTVRGSRLVVSISGDSFPEEKESLVSELKVLTGIVDVETTIIRYARDTNEEVERIRMVAGNNPVLLVTSAYHMHRALLACRRAGLFAVAAPTGYRTHLEWPFSLDSLFPSGEALNRWMLIMHEELGLAQDSARELLRPGDSR